MDSKIHTILKQSLQIFREYGIKSVSMDDLSSSMKISKKTLYKYFTNKENLLEKLFLEFMHLEFNDYTMSEYKKHGNAVEILFNIHSFITAQKSFSTPAISYDLQTNYPHIFYAVQESGINHAQLLIRKNIELGQTQNLYKKTINIDVIAYIFSQMSIFIEAPKEEIFSSKDLFNEILRVFIYSVGNEEGIKKFEMLAEQKI